LLERLVLLEKKEISAANAVGLVGAVGIELKATLKIRKLLILFNGRNVTNRRFEAFWVEHIPVLHVACDWKRTGQSQGQV
jgi:hypothetical protein